MKQAAELAILEALGVPTSNLWAATICIHAKKATAIYCRYFANPAAGQNASQRLGAVMRHYTLRLDKEEPCGE